MEPYKFEQDIKNKLEKRTIKPSANSWDKLSNSLQSDEKKKNSKFLILMGVAASIVGVLLLASIFFNKEKEDVIPTIVTVPVPQKEESLNKVEVEELVAEEDTSDKIKNEKVEISTEKKSISKQTLEPILEQEIVSVEEPIIEIEEPLTKVKFENRLELSSNVIAENKEIELVISKIENLKESHISVSTTDVDLLLKNAQKKLALERIYNENIKTVDAYKLLQDVEADIDKSTRTKILEALKLNYEHMKTVIAQRND